MRKMRYAWTATTRCAADARGCTFALLVFVVAAVWLPTTAHSRASIRDFEAQYLISSALNSFILGKPSIGPRWGRRCPNRVAPSAIPLGADPAVLLWDGDRLSEDVLLRIRELGFWPFQCQLLHGLEKNWDAIEPFVRSGRTENITHLEYEFVGLSKNKCLEFKSYLAKFIVDGSMIAAIEDVVRNAKKYWEISRGMIFFGPNDRSIHNLLDAMRTHGIAIEIQCTDGSLHSAQYDFTKASPQVRKRLIPE